MRKKVILIVALALLVVFGAVFAVLNIHAPGELSTWQKMEIEYHFQKWAGYEWGPWENEVDESKLLYESFARYYGSDNGYLIFFRYGNMMLNSQYKLTIGNYEFKTGGGRNFDFYVYKDGEFLYLKDAYEQGLISDAAIKSAWEKYRAYGS